MSCEPQSHGLCLRFITADGPALLAIEIESDQGAIALDEVHRVLLSQSVRVEGLELQVRGGRVRQRLTVAALDGGPILEDRRLQVQEKLLSVVLRWSSVPQAREFAVA